ncbi:MAG: hypothetical protein A3H28_04730 [Acidobacteria bacterium RIFCSPLOWO2_02_FULL_61_28]|nr:MAG: hypothetical protein A3H28_04730 [Acidobacteria bacterium RIFCSPLOWO2_02_FULL_61_28]
MRIGVDTGGTFTDCVVFDGAAVRVIKVFTNPSDPATASLEGTRRLAGRKIAEPLTLVHGTTAGTNTVLERRGARVALLTTVGFEDLIEIGRQNRPRLYDFNVERDPPLVPRGLRWGVNERTAADGSILQRPTAAEIKRLLALVKRSGAEAVAICFLFAFANPANERAVARAVRRLGLPVSISHEILPEFREYERLSTVVLNAYLVPRVGRYLDRLRQEARRSFRAPQNAAGAKDTRGAAQVFVMQSSGGITTAERAAREPVRTILSGPAGGVVSARWLADQLGIRRAISFDMGGTSTDVCLLDGPPQMTRETTLGGLPVAVPVLDVHSVGAGGGSLARFDAGGALQVGPESAGAVPGPACYARGGTQPTVTDAHLVLGRLDPEHFLGGEFRLDERAARESVDAFLRAQRRRRKSGERKEPSAVDLARGIVAVANANMEKALRVISVERGHDPRDFSLISFGGAGGLHACDLAHALRLAQVVVPPNPGTFSALGVLLSDIVKDVSQSVLLPVPAGGGRKQSQPRKRFLASLEERFARLERQARAELRRDKLPAESASAIRSLDVRYVGQSYELTVAFTARFQEEFHRAHERAYGYADSGRAMEVINLRLRLLIRTLKPPVRRSKGIGRGDLRNATIRQKTVWFENRSHWTPVYDRARLAPGNRFRGPAVVVEYSSTTVVPPDCVCRVDEYLNLVLTQHAR